MVVRLNCGPAMNQSVPRLWPKTAGIVSSPPQHPKSDKAVENGWRSTVDDYSSASHYMAHPQLSTSAKMMILHIVFHFSCSQMNFCDTNGGLFYSHGWAMTLHVHQLVITLQIRRTLPEMRDLCGDCLKAKHNCCSFSSWWIANHRLIKSWMK